MASILAIHAHPDDIEILAAGTLALLAAAGHRISIATVTGGDLGAMGSTPAETAAIRRAEAERSAALIGADYRCAGVPDLGVFNDDATRRKVVELVRAAGAEIVLTASPVDYHPDHEAVSVLARDACFAASVPNYRAGEAEPLDAVPHLYFMDPIGGRDREGGRPRPDFGVDVGEVFQTKAAMLACHASQGAWVAHQHETPDHLAAMEAWTRRRGRDFGVAMAEGFRQYRGHPYPRSPLLQTLLGGALRAPIQAD